MTMNLDKYHLKDLQGIWRLERYSTFEDDDWKDICASTTKLNLILQNLHLMVVQDNVLLLSISLPTETALSAYSKDTIGIGVINTPGSAIQKFRFKLARQGYKSGRVMAFECIQTLSKIIKLDAMGNDSDIKNHLYLPDLVSEILNKDSDLVQLAAKNNSDFPLEEFIITCITDENFPELVNKVNTIVQKYPLINKNRSEDNDEQDVM